MAFLLLCNYPVMGDLFSSLEAEYKRYLSRSCHNSRREHGVGRVSVKVGLSRFFQKSPAGPNTLKVPIGPGSRRCGSVSAGLTLTSTPL